MKMKGSKSPLFKQNKMAIIFQNGFGIGASNNGGGGGGPITNCSPSSTFNGNLNFSNGTSLTWSDDTSGFTLYNGGFTANDDGYSNNAIATLPSNFFMNCTGSTSVYMSTNGFITIGVGANNWTQSPQGSNPPYIGGNVGDLFIDTGANLGGGLTQGAYYRITNSGSYMKFELKVFEVMYQNQSHESSYQINLYKDSTYQWIETLTKDTSNFNYNSYNSKIGPTSSSDVSQIPSTTSSQVWRGDLSGQNWEYMGEGSIDSNVVSPTPTPTATLTPTPTPTPAPCYTNFSVSNCGTSHVYTQEPSTIWDSYGSNYLQVGPSVDGGGTTAPQAGWYFVDDCGTVRQLLNTVLWMSGGNPSPYPNGSGWLCEADGPFVISSGTTTLTFCESLPIVDTNPAVTPTNTPTPSVTQTNTPTSTQTPTPTPSSTTATSGFTITLNEVDSNVVMTGTGSIDLTGLTLVTSGAGPMMGPGMGVSSATFIGGATGGYYDTYSGFTTTPSNFGTGSGGASSLSSGDLFGVIMNMAPPYLLLVPSGYTSGTQISGSQTFSGGTFTTLGLTPGTYTYTWSGGSIDVVIGGPAPTPTPTPSVGSNAGQGLWYFYSDAGEINAGPPVSNGNVIFTINTGMTQYETFNPNKADGVTYLYFNLKDSTGTNYTSQFSGYTGGTGTITISQNGDTATYTSTTPGSFIIESFGGPNPVAFMISTAACTQTKSSNAPYVLTDPISITFS